MARWEPDAALRLVGAAIDLFAEQGYDATTVAQIAARAGLTKATFFRHFPDKREVLFTGQHTHAALLARGIAEAGPAATPREATAAGLDVLTAGFSSEQQEFGPRLLAVVADTGELQERSAFKRAALAEAGAAALEARGIAPTPARLAADLGVEAFHRAFARWVAPTQRPFGELARRELDELHAAIATLG